MIAVGSLQIASRHAHRGGDWGAAVIGDFWDSRIWGILLVRVARVFDPRQR
jgi:hypothetical protein